MIATHNEAFSPKEPPDDEAPEGYEPDEAECDWFTTTDDEPDLDAMPYGAHYDPFYCDHPGVDRGACPNCGADIEPTHDRKPGA